MKVGIAGAGIGGLTLALMLQRRGIEVEIWESAAEILPLGVGINILPHAAKELVELGLSDTLAEQGIETSSLAYFNKHGQLIWREARGIAAGYPWPQYSIHRGELQQLLLRAVRERLGPVVECGMRADSFENGPATDPKVRVQLVRPDGQTVERTVDVLVGADGIRSALRRQNAPESFDPLRFAGRVLWRGATEWTPFLDGRSMFMAGHPDQKFVAYPISEQARRRGRSRINWIAELTVPAAAHGDWNRIADKASFAGSFASWCWDWIDIPRLIEDTEVVYEFPLVDKDPLGRWSYGRMTLLGDAAHPLYPIGSNGSAQAILDARCLADLLKREPNVEYALREYEAERMPKTAAIALRNRLNGPEQVMYLAEARAPEGFRDVNEIIPQAELEEISARYKALAGFDVKSLKEAAARAAGQGQSA